MKNWLIVSTQDFSPGLKKVVGNTLWLLTDKFLEIGLGLIVGVWVARYLGPENLGIFNYALSFAALFGSFAALGLNSIVVRDLSRDSSQKDRILGTSFALKLVSGLFTFLLAVGLIFLLKPDEVLIRWLVGIVSAGTLFSAFEVINFWFQSQIQSKYIVIAKRIVYLLVTGIRIVLVYTQAPLIAFAIARLLEIGLGAICLAIMYRSKGNRFALWKVDFKLAKRLLREGWPLIFSSLTVYIYSKIDQVMLGSLLEDASELGFYSIAVKLSEFFDFLPLILSSSLLPKLTELKSRGEKVYQEKLQIYFDLSTILWLLIAMPVSILSPFIINLLYGDAFMKSATILSIYIWGQFGTNLGMARSVFIIIENKLKLSLYLSITGAILNIVINLFLIPLFGAIGATVATIITYFTVTVLLNFIITDLKPTGTMILHSLNIFKSIKRIKGLTK